MNKLLLRTLTLLALPISTGGTLYRYNKDFKCTDPVAVNVYSASCQGMHKESLCGFGEEFVFTGNILLTEDLPTSKFCMKAQACFWGIRSRLTCSDYVRQLDICNELDPTSNQYGSSTACPWQGEFYFEEHVRMPGPAGLNFGHGWWWWNAYITLEDCDTYSGYKIECAATFDTVANKDAYAAEEVTQVSTDNGEEYYEEGEEVADGEEAYDEANEEYDEGNAYGDEGYGYDEYESANVAEGEEYYGDNYADGENYGENYGDYNYDDYYYAAGGLFGVTALGYFVARKRRAAKIDLAQEEKLATAGHFEMMSDKGVRV